MRNSTILVTVAIAVVAGGLAFALSQSNKLGDQSPITTNVSDTMTNTTDVTADATTTDSPMVDTADADINTTTTAEQVALTDTTDEQQTASVTDETAAQQATAEITSGTEASVDATTADAATRGMTPVDLGGATTLNSQETAAGTSEQKSADETPATKFKVDVAAALEDRTLGSPNAPITVEDFSSLTCPHCASFHNTILPEVKKNYIDTGKVRWVFRGFPLNEPALKAEMISRCAPDDQFIKLQDLMYANQQRWAFSDDPLPSLNMLLRLAGITDDMFLACANNKELETALAKKYQELGEKYDLNSTPTFVINGRGDKKIEGAGSYTGFAFDLDEAEKALNEARMSTPAKK